MDIDCRLSMAGHSSALLGRHRSDAVLRNNKLRTECGGHDRLTWILKLTSGTMILAAAISFSSHWSYAFHLSASATSQTSFLMAAAPAGHLPAPRVAA